MKYDHEKFDYGHNQSFNILLSQQNSGLNVQKFYFNENYQNVHQILNSTLSFYTVDKF